MKYSSIYLVSLKKMIEKELYRRYKANIRPERQRCSLCCRLWEGKNKTCRHCGVIS